MSAVLLALCGSLASFAGQGLPTFSDVRAAHRPSDITLTDRVGTPVQTVRVDKTVRRLAWVPLADMSPALLHAIVLSEDKGFWQHGGIDWSAIATSAWANAWNQRTRGASTLTMQLAGLLDDGLARPTGGRSFAQKIGQALTARQLEASWSKSEILEAYLNSASFRGELVGIDALALTLFGKHASGLDAQEAALAAALLRGPNAAPTVVAERACGILQLERLPCAGVQALAATAFVRRGGMPIGEQLAPHFARLVVRSDGPPVQRTTLDAGLQRVALRALREQLSELAGRNVEDGAAVVLDNATGEVRAWVGSSGDLSSSREVDGVLARRQPGSTLKPFVYELAFERRLITPATLLDDSPAQIATAGGLYLPQNYDHDFKGWISARTALGASLNVPAVRVGTLLGPDALVERLNALGLDLPHPGGWYGQSLVLGSAEVTLLALTNAYRAFANGGVAAPVAMRVGSGSVEGRAVMSAGREAVSAERTALSAERMAVTSAERGARRPASVSGESIASRPASRAAARSGERNASPPDALPAAPSAPDRTIGTTAPRRVADAAAVHLTTDILADNGARVRTFGLDSRLATRGFAAVKTGTSKDMRDNWCIGWTDRYTVGVWVGNASGAAMHGVSGVSGAAPVWAALVAHLHAGRASVAPRMPAGVVAQRVEFDPPREPARDELYLAGTEQPRLRSTAQTDGGAERFGITSPRDGGIYALDPDIPPAAQRITFEGARGTWRLDGRVLGSGAQIGWAPWPGRHVLRLVAANGERLGEVRFEVRGAGLAAPAARVQPRANTRSSATSITMPQRL